MGRGEFRESYERRLGKIFCDTEFLVWMAPEIGTVSEL